MKVMIEDVEINTAELKMADMLLTRLHFRNVIKHPIFHPSFSLRDHPHLRYGNGLPAIVVHDRKPRTCRQVGFYNSATVRYIGHNSAKQNGIPIFMKVIMA